MNSQLKEARHLQIAQIIRNKQKVSISDLSNQMGVSEITIRRDLHDLANSGIVHRVYGGAVIVQEKHIDPPVLPRINQEKEFKESIGRTAAALVKDGESIFIGSGSTTSYVARNLINRKGLTVITNALNIGLEFSCAEGITVVVTGGMLRPSELSMVGYIAEQALKEVRVDKVIMGITALDIAAGLSNAYLPEVMTDRAIFAMAKEVILVADHTKFGKVASGYVAPVTSIKTLITDIKTPIETVTQLREMGIEVILAEV